MRKAADKFIIYLFVLAFTLLVYGILASYFIQLWTVDATGVSAFNLKLPEWDFVNLWTAGHLTLSSQLDTLFNVSEYRAFLHAYFHATLEHHEWSYPPTMLLIAIPFALLPLLPAYLLWTAGTWALLCILLRTQRLDWRHAAVALFSPAVLLSILIGQNGCFTAFLLLGCLFTAPKRPVLAGILLGILTVKPQLCLIAGIALLSTGNWRAVAAAAVTTVAMAVVTTLLVGFHAWELWQEYTLPFMMHYMNGPHPQPGMQLSITPFYSLRDVNVSLVLATALQWLVTILCIITAWKLWRREDVTLAHKIALSTMLTMLASPYALVYDLVCTSVAVCLLMDQPGKWRRASLYLLWTLPSFVGDLNVPGICIVPLFIAVPAILYYPRASRPNQADFLHTANNAS